MKSNVKSFQYNNDLSTKLRLFTGIVIKENSCSCTFTITLIVFPLQILAVELMFCMHTVTVTKMCKTCKWDDWWCYTLLKPKLYYIMYINRANFTNLQHRSLKLGKLLVLQKTHPLQQNILFSWQLTLFQSPPTWFQYVSDFQLEKH